MKKTRLKSKSAKQIERDKEWAYAKQERINYFIWNYGAVQCEYQPCTRKRWSTPDGIWWIGAHHIDGDRRNGNNYDNVFLVHNGCHTLITHNGEKPQRIL